MKKTIITTALVGVALQFTGCSSYPETKEGVAKAACAAFKAQDMDEFKKYLSKETDESVMNKIEKSLNDEEKAKRYKDVNCEKVVKTKARDSRTIYYFGEDNFDVPIANTKSDDKFVLYIK